MVTPPKNPSTADPTAEHGDRVESLFDQYSAIWENKYRVGGPLYPRLQQFVTALRQRVPSGSSILDFGCGAGDISAAAHEAGYIVTGVDRSDKMIESAKHRFGDRIQFRPIEGSGTLPFPDRTFDAVMASSVFEYVPDLRSSLRELARVTRPGGTLLCTVPNPSHRTRRMERRLKPLFALLRPLLFGKLKQKDEYLSLSVNRFSVDEWSRTLAACGWNFVDAEGHDNSLLMLFASKS